VNVSPTPKVAGAGMGGGVAVILIWLIESSGVTVPAEVAGAIASLVSFALAWLIADNRPTAP
jgi:hypothetical protein